jgi:SAM-dependent methyltransferase
MSNQKNKTLDIGCGNGQLLIHLNLEFPSNENYGIELDTARYEGMLSNEAIGNDFIKLGFPSRNFQKDNFQCITMFDVIEHIPNPADFLKSEVFDLLSENGVFVFQTPNKFTNSIKETIETKSWNVWRIEHCSLQTRKSSIRILKLAGFEEIHLSRFSFNSEFKRMKIKSILGFSPTWIIWFIEHLPTYIYPNIWGYAIKKRETEK